MLRIKKRDLIDEEITLTQVFELLKTDNLIIFYYSKNTAIPVFFTKLGANYEISKTESDYGFKSPIFNRKVTFVRSTLSNSIQAAQQMRDVFILKSSEYGQLFRIK